MRDEHVGVDVGRRSSKEVAERAGTSKKPTAKQAPHSAEPRPGVDPDTGAVRPEGQASQRPITPAPSGEAESKVSITEPDNRGAMPPTATGRMSTSTMKTTLSNPARKI
jgi:hypothetical protein